MHVLAVIFNTLCHGFTDVLHIHFLVQLQNKFGYSDHEGTIEKYQQHYHAVNMN